MNGIHVLSQGQKLLLTAMWVGGVPESALPSIAQVQDKYIIPLDFFHLVIDIKNI